MELTGTRWKVVERKGIEPSTFALRMRRDHAARPAVHKKVRVVRTCLSENTDHPCERRVHPGAHVQRLDGEPGGIDPNHFRKPLSHLAHSRAAEGGHSTLTTVEPRRISTRIRGSEFADLSIATGMNRCASIGGGSALGGGFPRGASAARSASSASTTHRRSRFAFSDRDIATAAIETPGCRQAATASALNSALYPRRRRRSTTIVFTCPLPQISGHVCSCLSASAGR